MIRAIIFDLDGVVINSEPLWDRSQDEFLGRRGIAYDKGMKHLITGKSVVEGVRIMQQMHGFGGDPEALAFERRTIVGELFRSELEFVDGFEEFYVRHRDSHAMCIATALDRELVEIVNARMHLSEMFRGHIYTIADVGMRSKPQPDIFLHGAAQLEVTPEECVVIEDAPYGIEAALRAGMKCVALTTTYTATMLMKADAVCRGFLEIDLDKM